MANTFNLGNGNWAQKTEKLLAYNAENDNYKPLPFSFDRGSTATVVNKDGLIETVGVDEPRIDFLNNTKGHLLLEPQRTNSLLQSNQFDTTWTLSASIDLTSGQTGVGGSDNAWLLKKNNTGSRYIQQSLSLSSAQYSYSVYLKAESTNWGYLWSYDGSASVNAYFDLENGVVGTTSGTNLNDAKIESVGNGWYRCTLIYTQATTSVRIYPADADGSISPTTDNGIFIQYAQLEAGSYATSYIPTSGSAVTRSAETCNSAGNSTVFNESEGVLYAEIAALDNEGSATSTVISINDGTSSNRIHLFYFVTDNTIYANYRSGGTTRSTAEFTLSNTANVNKFAYKWKSGDFALWVNGVEVDTDTNTTMISSDTLDELDFYAGGGGSNFYGKVKDLKVYDTALSDSELQALTSG